MKKLFCLLVAMNAVIGAQDFGNQIRSGVKRYGKRLGIYTTAEIMAAAKNSEPFHDESLTRGGRQKHDEIGLNFLGARIEQVDYAFPAGGRTPPDTMGAVGPTQFVVAVNNRLRSFDKQTGIADGILDSKTDGFFSDISNGSATSDIRIRYDRFSERWFIIMVTVGDEDTEEDDEQGSTTLPTNNRIMFAVSDTKVITYFTKWSFFYIEVGEEFFLDYPTLGIDTQALYIGGLFLFANGTLPLNQHLYVVNKKALEEGELVFTEFTYLVAPPTLPQAFYILQGVDNFDKDASVGYFIGVDSFTPNHLVLYRVFNPGSESPTLSDPFLVEIPVPCQPISVPHRNVSGVSNRNLAASNGTRLLMAQIRDGHLWTTHHVGVNNKGKCSITKQPSRDGSRWYEINVNHDQPSLMQYGTLFDKTKKNGLDARYYWMPSLNISGQGIMALGCSTAGENRFVDCAIARRFKDDPQGTLQKPIIYTHSDTTYNPTEPSNPLRWGDYSYTSVDPCDDMTIWTIQEYCVDTDQWGVQVAQLRAPAPAEPVKVKPHSIRHGKSEKLLIRGHSKDGSGFFDPGKNFDCHLQVKISGEVKVKKVKYIDPTTIKIKVSTKYASLGSKKIKIINPDGQKVVAYNLLTVVA